LNQAKENYSFKSWFTKAKKKRPINEYVINLGEENNQIKIVQDKSSLGVVRVTYDIKKGLKPETSERFDWPTGGISEFDGLNVHRLYGEENQQEAVTKALTPEGQPDVKHDYIVKKKNLLGEFDWWKTFDFDCLWIQ
jgi:hypothetical protein